MSTLRASDADRDAVVEVLHTAYSEGRLTPEEHSERVEQALAAKTFDELTGLTSDLVEAPAALAPVEPGDEDRMTAILSDVKRVGPWQMRRVSNANCVLGTVKLDLTEATFEARELEINGTQFFGTLFLRVPEGTTIRDESTKIGGSVSIKDVGDPDPKQPVIVLRGTVMLGDIKVRGPRRGTFGRKAIR